MRFNPVGEKIVEAFLSSTNPSDQDKTFNQSETISFSQFVRTFAVFRPIHKSQMDNADAPNSKVNKVNIFFNIFKVK